MARTGLLDFVRLIRHRGGAAAPILAVMLVAIAGSVGLGVEGSYWYVTTRAMQNAADSAVLAAAMNGCTAADVNCAAASNPNYDAEARAVTARYGFTNGVNATTIVANNAAACPAGGSTCVKITISRELPLSFTRMVGFTGSGLGSTGAAMQMVSASATSTSKGVASSFCIIGLDTTGNAIRVNGGPNVSLKGCSMRSNSGLTCNGANADTGVDYGFAAGAAECGTYKVPNAGTIVDPFARFNANPPIPTNNCITYPQGVAGPTLGGATSFAAPVKSCGSTRLTGNINVTTANSVLVIYNGNLNLNGFNITTTGAGSLAIVFSGTPTSTGAVTYQHYITGSGTVDIAAPSSGSFGGVAIMQDSRLTGTKNGVDHTYAGNTPRFNIQGLIYYPNGNFDMRGAINKKTNGLNCLGLVTKTILVSGGGSIFDNATADCLAAGLTLPSVPGSAGRPRLVS